MGNHLQVFIMEIGFLMLNNELLDQLSNEFGIAAIKAS